MGQTYTRISHTQIEIRHKHIVVARCQYVKYPFFPNKTPPPILQAYIQKHPRNYYYIYNMYVNPSYRLQGLCKKIIRMVIETIQSKDPQAVLLLHIRYSTDKIPAYRKCYEHVGFKLNTDMIETYKHKHIALFSYPDKLN